MVKIFLLRWLGNFLVLSSLAAFILTFWPVLTAEVTYRLNQARGVHYAVSSDLLPAREEKPVVNLLSPGFSIPEASLEISPLSTDFGLIIPQIGANAKIIADVDAGNQKVYAEALRRGVAHARGTAYPGEIGNSFLFAHSVGNFWEINRWNAVFYLLKELRAGDEVELFYKNKRFTYTVYDTKIVNPEDTQYLSTFANFPMLTLQTCWPPGTTLKRLLVFARLRPS
jgi:sortase A